MNHQTIYENFEEIVKELPEQIAIAEENQSLTYEELNRRINTIVRKFPSQVDVVGIVTDHGADQVASIFAVLKKGAAYVPAEPDFPEERIRFMMKESGASFIVTQKKYKDKLKEFPLLFLEDFNTKDASRDIKNIRDIRDVKGIPVIKNINITEDNYEQKEENVQPESLAYILYISGSTGVPQGVSVTNANVCHYVRAFQHEFHPNDQDTMLQYSVCSFDIFVEEVFTTLLSGATLAIPNVRTKENLYDLMDFVQTKNVTMISGFPCLLMEMNELKEIPSCLRLLISGGDILRESYVNHLLPQVTVYNTYGPSETTVCCSYFQCNGHQALDDGPFPVGKAVLGASIELLDEDNNPVPTGSVGEICIAGDGVSDGYIDKNKNEMFVTDENGKRFYRSGDLGKLLPDGNLAFLHRKDSQVMIMGKRVEPEEVENVLCGCEEVETAVVCPFTDEHGLSYLTAYVVPEGNQFVLSE
ncbi:MAG: amino acid adenylation domain-containing protein [Clostridiales bacterium]|nr:amino acid adenylation domain-containing protein [Clostridiales bacterium]